MLDSIASVLHQVPELALFLALALGYAVGQIRFGPIQLGGVCGTLIAALLIGQLGICLLYTSPSPRDATLSRMPSSA